MFVGVVASSYSVLALDAAGQLDFELAAAVGHLDSLRERFRDDARMGPLLHSIRTVAAAALTVRQLRKHLAHATSDEAHAPIEIYERALRARWSVVFRAVHAISHAEQDAPRAAFIGRFLSVRDVVAHLVDQLAEIHVRWNQQRRMHLRHDVVTRHALAYAALDEAEIAFERLGRDFALRHFLRVSIRSSSPSIRMGCREIAATLGLSPHFDQHEVDDVEPDESAPRLIEGHGR